MTRLLKNLSIRAKLIAIMLAATGAALIPLAGAVVWIEARDARDALQQQLQTLASVIAAQSTAALVFDDSAAAREILASLAAKRDIRHAAILDSQGVLFARYQPLTRAQTKPSATTGRLMVTQQIRLEDQTIGEVRIASDVTQVQEGMLRYTTLMSVMLAGSFALAFGVSSRLHRVISRPIFELRHAALEVSQRGDYNVRVTRTSQDELGALVDGFNHMLDQVEERDRALARYNTDLETEVARRTRELDTVNRQRIEWLENLARFLRHELKNAGIGIKTSLDLIERRTAHGELDVYVGRARKSLAYMGELLESVGNASTLEASFYRETHVPLDLTQLVASRFADYRALYPEQQLAADVAERVYVRGSVARLVQLLDNLVSNAVTHCTTGTCIRIELATHGPDALLAVTNQGDRLPEDKVQIFELFVSLRPRQRREDDNLGLGLYLVRLIAESHGGRVRAEELTEANGARFTVALPLLSGPFPPGVQPAVTSHSHETLRGTLPNSRRLRVSVAARPSRGSGKIRVR